MFVLAGGKLCLRLRAAAMGLMLVVLLGKASGVVIFAVLRGDWDLEA